MAIGILALLVLAVLGFALWRSRPAGGAPWRFSTALLMAAGALIALTTGLCSLAGGLFLLGTYQDNSGVLRREGFQMLILMVLGGFTLMALGIWIFRRGRARVRADEGKMGD